MRRNPTILRFIISIGGTLGRHALLIEQGADAHRSPRSAYILHNRHRLVFIYINDAFVDVDVCIQVDSAIKFLQRIHLSGYRARPDSKPAGRVDIEPT